MSVGIIACSLKRTENWNDPWKRVSRRDINVSKISKNLNSRNCNELLIFHRKCIRDRSVPRSLVCCSIYIHTSDMHRLNTLHVAITLYTSVIGNGRRCTLVNHGRIYLRREVTDTQPLSVSELQKRETPLHGRLARFVLVIASLIEAPHLSPRVPFSPAAILYASRNQIDVTTSFVITNQL